MSETSRDHARNAVQKRGSARDPALSSVEHRARRVLIVTHTGEIGGAEYVLLDIVRHYGSRCHVLLFAGGPLTERLSTLGIGYTVLPAGAGMSGVRRESSRLRALMSVPSVVALAVRVALTARHYDVVYPNSQKAAVVTMLVARLIRRPLIWHLHDILSPEHFGSLQRWLVTRLANLSARRVIAVSEAARETFIQSGGDPERAVVVYNGFDTVQKPSADVDVATIRSTCGAGDAPLAGLFGRISRWKGQHVLLQALPALPGLHVIIVGKALFNDAEYLNELHKLAAELGVAERVHWLGHRDDVSELMQAVDVVLHTSTLCEPFGRVIAEGMLAGRPVLATDHGAARELLGDEPLALVPPGNSDLLARAVQRMLALSPEERATLGAHNRARAEGLFSLQGMLVHIETAIALDVPA